MDSINNFCFFKKFTKYSHGLLFYVLSKDLTFTIDPKTAKDFDDAYKF